MKSYIQGLNNRFAILNQVLFVEGKGGLPFLQVNTQKASALISIYAAQVLSFKPCNQIDDFFFVSDKAYFEEGKAIRGGIPICWPWFGDAATKGNPAHGFVRNSLWNVSAVEILASGNVRVVLEYKNSQSTEERWPYAFCLSLEVLIGDSLTMELVTANTGDHAFKITEALHTYFNVGDVGKVSVSGLDEHDYLDKTEHFIKKRQVGDVVFLEETDRIYMAEQEVVIDDVQQGRQIKIKSAGNKNIVVWNPWLQKEETLADLNEYDYEKFVCIETANVASEGINVLPNNESRLKVNFSV